MKAAAASAPKNAIQYLVARNARPDWLTPDLYRIGASSLGDILMQLRAKTGRYQSPDYFTNDVEKRQTPPVPQGWTSAPAPEWTDIVKLRTATPYIGGSGCRRRAFTTISPRDESCSPSRPGERRRRRDAVAAARDAFKSWSRLRDSERSKYLFRDRTHPREFA
jgi:hypothetical protein